ncbi:MAG: EcsC family protein [Roseburia sp.]|nr:EcsC family protein [Roseburia sp.]
MRKKHIEKEWAQVLKQEENFLHRNLPEKQAGWQEKITRFVPEKLDDTLNTAFFKAFELIFEKGMGVIEKTYSKEKKQQNYKINEYTAEVRGTRRALRAFGREAGAAKNVNTAISAAEGVGMGLLGMGLPDIPLFLGVLLKSIYEIAVSYGFSYDTEEEQIFILKIIETALSHGEELMKGNTDLNLWTERQDRKESLRAKAQGEESEMPEEKTAMPEEESKMPEEKAAMPEEERETKGLSLSRTEQIRRTSDALSRELLYLKFVQGIPVVGVVGGLSDMVYQKKISDFAAIKYRRRFLAKKKPQDE